QVRAPNGLVWQWDVIKPFLLVMTPPVVAIFLMIWCGFSILRRFESVSPSSTYIHKQLLRALIVQASIPVLFIFVPLGLQFVMPLVGGTFSRAGMVTATFTAFFPVIDPLLVISLVPLYRTKLSKWCTAVSRVNITVFLLLHNHRFSRVI
ncbi:hypothetical protein PENTCL1PPCAC_15019, partial [Pristionchus entomophagus]